ncbi:hypothetical protein D9M68_877990 [compost metagenome]
MAHLGKAFGRWRADRHGGAVFAHQMGEGFLDGVVAAAHRVISRVGDLGRVLLVIGDIGLGNGSGEAGQLGVRFLFGEIVDGFGGQVGHWITRRRLLFLVKRIPPS